jgi:hypothetical protein
VGKTQGKTREGHLGGKKGVLRVLVATGKQGRVPCAVLPTLISGSLITVLRSSSPVFPSAERTPSMTVLEG